MTRARQLADLLDANGDVKSTNLDNVPAVDLTNLSASNLTSGSIPDARVPASAVSQHATSFDDNKIVNDISTLGLRVHTQENLNASNSNSASFDVFQDSSAISNLTNVTRNASEYVDSTSTTTDPNTKALWTTTIDNHGDAIGGSPGTPVVDSTGTLQLQAPNTDCQTFSTGNAAPPSGFGTRSIRTAGWDNSTNNKGFWIREVSGQTSDLNFGAGAYTIEMWVKQVDNNYNDDQHHYIYDLANSSGGERSTMAPYHGTNGSNAYNGHAMGTGGSYAWNDFGVGNWKYVAFVRDGSGNVANFLNGTRVIYQTSYTNSVNYTDSNNLGIGHRYNGENASRLYLNNIRISNVARYNPTSSSMTIPTSRFTLTTQAIVSTGSFTGNNITASSSTNKMGAVITYQDNAGTNALNTDIVLQLSADGGSNYSTATLTALPDFATGIKMAKVNDLSVTAGTSLKYKISFANQASGSKEARIRGVSLQY